MTDQFPPVVTSMVTEENFSADDFANMPELLSEAVARIHSRMKNPKALAGIYTGFGDVDRFTSGLKRGDFIVLAGRPGMGENILALNIAEHVALMSGLSVAILDMERGGINLAMLLLASHARINYYDLCHGKIDDEQSERFLNSADILKNSPIHISTTAAVSVHEVGDRLRRLIQRTGSLGLVVLNCLPELKLTSEMADKKRVQEIATISRQLKVLAKELDVPIVVLSPVNRDLEERVNKRPQLVDLPCGGSIASAADLVLCVYRDSIYDCESADQGLAEIIIAKNTNGSAGSLILK